MRRGGWTLHELLISLAVMSSVMALAAHWALGQLRFIHRTTELSALRGDVGESAQIAGMLLWGASPSAGDITIALDSVVELQLSIGAAIVCESQPGRVTVPAPDSGNALASFSEWPREGDRMIALFEDTLGSTWLTFQVNETSNVAGACPAFPAAAGGRTVMLESSALIPPGTSLRFTRPLRLSHYRGSDDRWYLGAREWNAASHHFNTIQPVAGPLAAFTRDPARTGLLFIYRDSAGAQLVAPAEPGRIASVTTIARASSADASDSTSVTVALRNHR